MRVHWTNNALKHFLDIYRIKPDQIDVLAVVHGARLLCLDIEQGE